MEKFAVDLDRVLDEFELNEDLESLEYQKNTKSDSVQLLKNEAHKSESEFRVPYSKPSPPSTSIEPSLDLSDADFAPSLSYILLKPSTFSPELSPLELKAVTSNSNVEPESNEIKPTDGALEVKAVNNETGDDEVNLLLGDFVDDTVNDCSALTTASDIQEFTVDDSIKPLHNDETINKDYLITFGRKREPSVSKVIANAINSVVPTDIEVRNEADGASQTNLEEIVQITPTQNGPNSETSELDESFATPDDGSSFVSPVTGQVEPASFSADVEVTDDDIQRYLENEPIIDETKFGFEDFYTPVTDTVLRENDLLRLENEETVAVVNAVDTEMPQMIDNLQSCDLAEANLSITNSNDEIEHSIYDTDKYHSDSTLEDDVTEQRMTRPTSLSLPSKIQEPSGLPPAPDSNDLDSAVEDGDATTFMSLTATAGSPDAGLGLSPDDDEIEEESSESMSSVSAALRLTDEEKRIGKVAPVWIPDSEALNCMECGIKFTVIRRRHHCRACGRVLCGNCCGLKAKMTYMDNKEARVCQLCLDVMSKVQQLEALSLSESTALATGHDGGRTSDLTRPSVNSRSPNPNNPSEYCSLIPPLQQATPNLPPPTVMVPVGVLKRVTDGPKLRSEPKQVMFSDGIRPGGDLTELDGPDQKPPYRRLGRLQRRVDRQSTSSDVDDTSSRSQEYSINDNLDPEQLFNALKDEANEPLTFVVTRHLKVLVKIVNLSCCVKKLCWCVVSQGLLTVGQDEVVILIELMPDEMSLPVDVFYHLSDLYDDASKGSPVTHMGHTVSPRPLFGAKDHVGFLYFRPTFQCLKKIPLPQPPFLFGVLLQKWEVPWAKVFPLRLLLRLGSEYRYYPCPLYGVRFRTPIFFEIGHTIVNLLADFRNYQYSMPSVPGLVIHMKDGETTINFPRNRYDEVVKALNTGIDHVLALAASFSTEADSHLVCIQNDQGNYLSQAISIDDQPRRVTGASFVVFNGALKSSSGLTAKSSIVEDGVMVHIPAESMVALRQTLQDMKDYVVACGPIGAEKPDEIVRIQWVSDDRSINIGVRSAIDGKPLDGVTSIRVHRGMDYVGENYLIRWTEVYIIKNDTVVTSRSCDPTDVSKVSDTLAQACCLALASHLSSLYSNGLNKIGLRITLDSESVGYEVGANEKVLPSCYMNDLDSELVPAIHSAASFHQEGSLVLELIFHILQQ
ncbi:Zinc finger FYVE domain-containing protein 16 [Chamberlinius hualienensis]